MDNFKKPSNGMEQTREPPAFEDMTVSVIKIFI